MPDLDGLDMLREIKAVTPSPHVITITAFGSIDTAIRAVKLGAFDYITKPFDVDQLILSVQKALDERALRSELARLRDEVQRSYRWGNIIGKSAAMQEMFALIRRLSRSTASVLVTGASGTGKELVAQAIHFNSPRRDRPFVAVNCAAIPDTLLESELFGYKRGAFTDARTDRAGLFVEADGGTIFLDEIAELSPALQAKLLRVLQEGEIRPLGAARSQKVDVRVRRRDEQGSRGEPGQRRVPAGSVLPAERDSHPPAGAARSRRGHPAAGRAFPGAAARRKRGQGRARRFTRRRRRRCSVYGWPGNVRELENVVERAVALVEGPLMRVDDLPPLASVGRERARPAEGRGATRSDPFAAALARGLTLAELERDYIMRVLGRRGGQQDARRAAAGARPQDAVSQARGVRRDGRLAPAEARANADAIPGQVLSRRSNRRRPGAVAGHRSALRLLAAADRRAADRGQPAGARDGVVAGVPPGVGRARSERPPVRILVEPDAARIEAPPALHRPGSPGALAVARAFGFPGVLSVEEIAIQPGDEHRRGGNAVRSAPRRGSVSHGRARARADRRDADVAGETLGQALLPWAVGHGGRVPGRHRPRDLGGVARTTPATRALPRGARRPPPPTYLERAQLPHPRLP